jgi:hypothetical protein
MGDRFPVEDDELFAKPHPARKPILGKLGCLGLLAILPVTCCVNTMRSGAEYDRLVVEAGRLGVQVSVPPGDAGWDGIGLTTYYVAEAGNKDLDDAGLERLIRLPAFARVRGLSLAGTRVTDKGVGLLEGLPLLTRLDLSRTAVTDLCMAPILRSSLGGLNLSGTAATDQTVELLIEQPETIHLRMVDLTDTRVTEEKVRRLGRSKHQNNYLYGPSKTPKQTLGER